MDTNKTGKRKLALHRETIRAIGGNATGPVPEPDPTLITITVTLPICTFPTYCDPCSITVCTITVTAGA